MSQKNINIPAEVEEKTKSEFLVLKRDYSTENGYYKNFRFAAEKDVETQKNIIMSMTEEVNNEYFAEKPIKENINSKNSDVHKDNLTNIELSDKEFQPLPKDYGDDKYFVLLNTSSGLTSKELRENEVMMMKELNEKHKQNNFDNVVKIAKTYVSEKRDILEKDMSLNKQKNKEFET